MIEEGDSLTSFAFTYPFSYSMLQDELSSLDSMIDGADYELYRNDSIDEILYHRELLTRSCDGRRIDLITISSTLGCDFDLRERCFEGLFPGSNPLYNTRPYVHPNKQVVFISARVHPGEVPAQHTFKGILDFLLDKNDLRARELRHRYVFKMIPMLNPDGKPCKNLVLH
jgi:cytosolic carboxypeptidase protein 5